MNKKNYEKKHCWQNKKAKMLRPKMMYQEKQREQEEEEEEEDKMKIRFAFVSILFMFQHFNVTVKLIVWLKQTTFTLNKSRTIRWRCKSDVKAKRNATQYKDNAKMM